MNDFTKEELELIHDGLSYAAGASIETGGMVKDILYPVAKKIQSMIDNYGEQRVMVRNEPRNIEEFIENCKHDWDDFEPNYCVKCKQVF